MRVFRSRLTVSIRYNPSPISPLIFSTGTSVSVIGSNNLRNDSGVLDPTWECFVDHISIGKTAPFQFAENNWLFCERTILVDGPHILTVNATVSKNQTFWFDAIQYVPSASVPLALKAILVDSDDEALQYGNGWRVLSTANTTEKTGSVLNFEFYGESARRPSCSLNRWMQIY